MIRRFQGNLKTNFDTHLLGEYFKGGLTKSLEEVIGKRCDKNICKMNWKMNLINCFTKI